MTTICVKSIQKERRVKRRNFVIFFSSNKTIVIFCHKSLASVFVLKRHKFFVQSTSSETQLTRAQKRRRRRRRRRRRPRVLTKNALFVCIMAIAEAYQGRKPASSLREEEEERIKNNSGMNGTDFHNLMFDAYSNNSQTIRNVALLALYTIVVLSIGAIAFTPSSPVLKERGVSKFSDGITKVYTSDLMGNRFAGVNDQKNQCSRDLALHMLREAYFKRQEADARLPKVSMDDKGRWGALKEKQKKAHAELQGKQDCVAYLMPDVNDAFSADLEAGLTIDGKQMKREQEKMQPIRDSLRRDGREGFEDQRYTQSIRNALIKEKTWDPFGRDLKTGDELFTGEFDNNVPGQY